ncbi:MAG: 3-hydroxyacyl-CoA dehydrogenase [Burkholderiales bacterium]|nr:3-hydroxyacyl-CoA dehydrogenase [Burkholderiales bacterium]
MQRTAMLPVRKVAVLGAGVMGAQIAAHFANAGVRVVLFELASKEGDPNASARKAIEGLRGIDPQPLASPALAAHIEAANYDQDLGKLHECDLIVEAVAERIGIKNALYARITPHLNEATVFATNTSGLSIQALAQALPEAVRPRFCGVHFFNPPRYMYLVELIPARESDPAMLDRLEAFLVSAMGKGVVRAKDTPNFIANRIGVFSILAAFHHTQTFDLGFDVVDALTGPLIGRPRSATYRTADLVGLDTLAHVVNTMTQGLPEDPWHRHFVLPVWYRALLEAAALGQKSGRGIYRKAGRNIEVLDRTSMDYRASAAEADAGVAAILKTRDPVERFDRLRASTHPHARFLWACLRDMLHYCAVHLGEIADNARDVDLAMRWGFGWSQGPFELWQAIGWQRVTGWIDQDIRAGRTMSDVALPAWVHEPARTGVHQPDGSYSAARAIAVPRPALPVYRRQPCPDRLVGEHSGHGTTVLETAAVRMWSTGDDIAVLGFRTKMNTISEEVIHGVRQALEEAERGFKGLILWQPQPPFSAGANVSGQSARASDSPRSSGFARIMKQVRRQAESAVLKAARRLNVADALMAGRLARVEEIVEQFQAMTQAWKYSSVPAVSAVEGLALGGGCEIILHSSRTVAALESYVGLVEPGIGLLPAGGGCKELALRAAQEARGGDVFPYLRRYFQNVATAEVGKSAVQARDLGYLGACDRIVMNRAEVLHVAKSELNALVEAGYRAPLPPAGIPVAGRSAIATIKAYMANMLEGQYISEHDYLVGSQVACVMCGGDVEGGTLVDEAWLLALERRGFMELLATEKTQARIEHTLRTGKPLRN